MQLTNQILANGETIKAFIKNYPADTPVVMVNILRFKDKTGNGEETGRESYAKYMKAAKTFYSRPKVDYFATFKLSR